ncbi:hypothetical protein [Arabiibacter massiliensis]|uniref:hypothetical protein n=1 Tax=Arabiibacter massiliensis TaxID=1870985 RepID=UPI0009B9F6E4|nr:hypothetical protein [Arabiibacter massiliensis]
MEKITHHPLRAVEDALKRALALNGFTPHDDGSAREVEEPDWSFKLHRKPDDMDARPVLLEDGGCALRSELLAAQLASLRGPLPLRAFSAGRVYDARDQQRPG